MLGHNERHLSAVRRWPAGKRSAAVLFTESRLAGRFFSCGAGELNLPRSGSTIFNSGLLCGIRIFAFTPTPSIQLNPLLFQPLTVTPVFLAHSLVARPLVRTVVYTQGI